MNIEEDVNALIFSCYEENLKIEQRCDILNTILRQYGSRKIIKNLMTRSKTPPILDLIQLIQYAPEVMPD